MKKSRKIELIAAAFCVSGMAIYAVYDHWEGWFPVYEIGTCLEHRRSGRQYRLIQDKYPSPLDVGVPARILTTGVALPGTFTTGTVERIQIDDPHLKVVVCPTGK